MSCRPGITKRKARAILSPLGPSTGRAVVCPLCKRRGVRPDRKAMVDEMHEHGTPWYVMFRVRCSYCGWTTCRYLGPDGALALEAAVVL